MVIPNGVSGEEIKAVQIQREFNLLNEKNKRIIREIRLREQEIGNITNFKRRIIMKGILEDKKILKEQFELKLKELKKKL